MTDDSAHLRNELQIFKGVANELGGIVQGVVDALGIRRDAERDVVLAELGRRLLPAEPRALAGEAEPPDAPAVPPLWLTEYWGVIEPDGAGHYRTIENGMHVEALPADAVRLVPAGGSAPADKPFTPALRLGWLSIVRSYLEENGVDAEPLLVHLGASGELAAGGSALADEVEQLKWERDMALSRVAAAEAVEGRMADSLPASGPWESWSERDRAVRDYEGDLAAALAIETDYVAERLREVERERDEARAERDAAVAAVRGLVDNYAAHDQQAFEAAHEAAIAVLAGGSAPHQGATTDVTALVAHLDWLDERAMKGGHLLLRTDDVRALLAGKSIPIGPSADRALLGAGETTEADQ